MSKLYVEKRLGRKPHTLVGPFVDHEGAERFIEKMLVAEGQNATYCDRLGTAPPYWQRGSSYHILTEDEIDSS